MNPRTFLLACLFTISIVSCSQSQTAAPKEIPFTPVKRINKHEFRITLTGKKDKRLPLEITLLTGNGEPDLEVSWFTDEDPRPRVIPEIAGGDWERGKKLFFVEQVGCYKCHQISGEGGLIGPDLSNLLYCDYAQSTRTSRNQARPSTPTTLLTTWN